MYMFQLLQISIIGYLILCYEISSPLVIWLNLDTLENITDKFNISGGNVNRELEEVKNDNKTINNQ